jgi:hypothetical protein
MWRRFGDHCLTDASVKVSESVRDVNAAGPPRDVVVTVATSRDAWLFLTPEVEAELPAAVAALGAALGEHVGGADEEARRLEAIVVHGGYRQWLEHLRERRLLLERYVERVGGDALAGRVATVLNEQYLLALGLRGGEGPDEADRARAAALLRRVCGEEAR